MHLGNYIFSWFAKIKCIKIIDELATAAGQFSFELNTKLY